MTVASRNAEPMNSAASRCANVGALIASARASLALVRPMSSRCFCSESLLSDDNGKFVKMPMRWYSMRCVSAKAKRRSLSVPVAAEGSGSPQCALIG